MAILEIKKIKISLQKSLIFAKKTDILVVILRAKKKAVTDEVRTPIPTSSTKRYLAEYRLAMLQRFITIKVR